MKLNKEQQKILCIGLVNSVIWIIIYGVKEAGDSITYILAWDNLSQFRIDENRTPIYPIYLGLLKLLFGQSLFKLVAVVGQYIIYTVSALIFYQLSSKMISRFRLVYWMSLFYILIPGLFAWNNYILTESFSISGIVFLIYTTYIVYDCFSFTRWLYNVIFLFLLVSLRPSFVYLIPVFIVFWFVTFLVRKHEKVVVACSGIFGTLCVGSLFLLYSMVFKASFGVMAPSIVGDVNRYYMARQYGLLKPMDAESEEISLLIESQIVRDGDCCAIDSVLWSEVFEALGGINIIEIHKTLDNSFHNNPLGHIKAAVDRIYQAGFTHVFCGGINCLGLVWNYLVGIQIRHLYLFLIIYALIIIAYVYWKKQIPIFSLLLFMIVIANLFVSIIGAQNDWGRLNAAIMPVVLIMVLQILSFVRYKIIKSDFS